MSSVSTTAEGVNDKLAVVGYAGSRYQLREITVNGRRVAQYERNPVLFTQEFDVTLSPYGVALGLRGGTTDDPLIFISNQLCYFVNIHDQFCIRAKGHEALHEDDIAPFHQAPRSERE